MPRYEHDCERCIYLGTHREFDLYICPLGRQTVIARSSDKPGDYQSGMVFAEQALSYPLSKALAFSKQRGLYRSHVEDSLLPEHEKLLYLVNGSTGYGLDKRSWSVRAFRERNSARTFAKACQREAEIWLEGKLKESPPSYWSLLDPRMQVEDQVTYTIIPVPIATRPEELSSSWDTCPICRGQVYDTPEGRICERGHEGL